MDVISIVDVEFSRKQWSFAINFRMGMTTTVKVRIISTQTITPTATIRIIL